MITLAFLTGSPADWGIIFIVALVVFGPKKLPEIGKQLGQAMREFRKMADEVTGATHSIREEVESVYKPVLHEPPISRSTTSATVEQAVAHRPLDQEPEHDLMAPAVPPLSTRDAPVAAVETAADEGYTKGH
jgi:sec-independent protein translocase protein TatA